MMMNNLPLSLYIHIPWCIQKCPYCDFNSHALNAVQYDEKIYIQHLLADLDNDLKRFPQLKKRFLSSIFIGGGTPSLFSGSAITELLAGIHKRLNFSPEIEITLEANPSTFEQEKFKSYLNGGVNRLSLGIQSFNPQQLKNLGRIHGVQEAETAIKTAQDVGFKRINIDLMFALPNQTVSEALLDLEMGSAFQTEHLSWYQLTLEPNTAFYKNPPVLPDSDTQFEIFQNGSAFLIEHGFNQYETSAWTRNRPSAHNLNYWTYGDYLGIGAGAHGKITVDKKIYRQAKFPSPKQYQKALGKLINPYSAQENQVPENEQAFEFMMNALRLKSGVENALFLERTALSFADIESIIQKLKKKGLLINDEKRLQTTQLGYLHLNDVLNDFL